MNNFILVAVCLCDIEMKHQMRCLGRFVSNFIEVQFRLIDPLFDAFDAFFIHFNSLFSIFQRMKRNRSQQTINSRDIALVGGCGGDIE